MKVNRKIIKIDEERCTGCGLCVPGCPEGALNIVATANGPKARILKEFYCDGLGACIGKCPEGALSIIEQEVEPYDETGALGNIMKNGPDVLREHLDHLKEHGLSAELGKALEYLKDKETGIDLGRYAVSVQPKDGSCHHGSCPGSRPDSWDNRAVGGSATEKGSLLSSWPVQIALVNPEAGYLKGARLLIAADCTPFAYNSFHERFLKGRKALMGCPKLDDIGMYEKKLAHIFSSSSPSDITVVRMEVPCCRGMTECVERAVKISGLEIYAEEVVVGIKGDIRC